MGICWRPALLRIGLAEEEEEEVGTARAAQGFCGLLVEQEAGLELSQCLHWGPSDPVAFRALQAAWPRACSPQSSSGSSERC